MGWLDERARRSSSVDAEQGFGSCDHCNEPMPANAQFCGSCGYQRRVGGPTDGATPEPGSGIIVVSTGGDRPVSHALTDPTEEVLVIDNDGRAFFDVRPAPDRLVVDLTDPSTTAPAFAPGPAIPPPAAQAPPEVPPTQAAPARERRLTWTSTPVLVAFSCLLVALLAAAAFLLWPDPEPEIDVNAELATGAETLTNSVARFSRAELFADLSRASERADEAVDTYPARVDALAEVDDEEVQAAAVSVLNAERRLLSAFAITFSNYRTQDFANWDTREAQMNRRVNQLDRAQQDLAALENEDLVATVDIAATQATLTDLGRLIDAKQEEFETWQAERDALVGSQFAALSAVNNYANPFRGLLGQYSGLRQDLANWTDELDERVVYISEAYQVLGEARADRENVRIQMASLAPPAALSAAHASIIGVLDTASSAVDSAYEGVSQYINDPYWVYWDVRDTPGWDTFEDASDRISATYESAVSAWEAAVNAEISRIRSNAVPEPPVL